MTIEEEIQSVLTSGVATDQGASGTLDIGLEGLQNSQRYRDIRSAVVTTDYDDDDRE
jgi:hypothetical protein